MRLLLLTTVYSSIPLQAVWAYLLCMHYVHSAAVETNFHSSSCEISESFKLQFGWMFFIALFFSFTSWICTFDNLYCKSILKDIRICEVVFSVACKLWMCEHLSMTGDRSNTVSWYSIHPLFQVLAKFPVIQHFMFGSLLTLQPVKWCPLQMSWKDNHCHGYMRPLYKQSVCMTYHISRIYQYHHYDHYYW